MSKGLLFWLLMILWLIFGWYAFWPIGGGPWYPVGGSLLLFALLALLPTDDVYSIDIAASDLDGETIIFEFSANGADTRKLTMVTSP